jgi:hypothetical protein
MTGVIAFWIHELVNGIFECSCALTPQRVGQRYLRLIFPKKKSARKNAGQGEKQKDKK